MLPQRFFHGFLLAVSLAIAARADIYRNDNFAVIPGTEGIDPGPGVQLDHRDLAYARLSSIDLTGARFDVSNLTRAQFSLSTLTDATWTGAVVNYASFYETTSRGFTREQLYSTASYEAKNLPGIDLGNNDLSNWNFHGQNLAEASMFGSTVTDADLGDAVVTGANFWYTTPHGFTPGQLYSTASYKAKNLTGIGLEGNDLSGWDFHGQNLAGARLSASTLTGADLSDAIVTGTSFSNGNSSGITQEQLYSTASYKAKSLRGIDLSFNNDLNGWDFHGQDLTKAVFYNSALANADFSDAIVAGADLGYTTQKGFTKEQFYSTATYPTKDLEGISLYGNDLSDWDFSGQNLTRALLFSTTLIHTNFRGANLVHAIMSGVTLNNTDLTLADTRDAFILGFGDSRGLVTRNTILTDGAIAGLDLTGDDVLIVRNYQAPPSIGMPGPIPVTVHDGMKLADKSVLQLCFDDKPWESLISFEPGIPVQLGGTLELTFADDVDASTQIGRTIRLFDWTGVDPTGQFTVSSRYHWNASKLYSTGEVTLTAAPEPNAACLALTFAMLIACARLQNWHTAVRVYGAQSQ